MEGEVNTPGFYKFNPGKRISDIISLAGGFSPDANKDNVFIRYPNGSSKKYSRWFNNGKVIDGSIITVGTPDEYAKEVTSIIASLADY